MNLPAAEDVARFWQIVGELDGDDIVNLLALAVLLLMLAANFGYLSVWVIPRKVQFLPFRLLIFCSFLWVWSLPAFLLLAGCDKAVDSGKHTRIQSWIWDTGCWLLLVDLFSLAVCIGAVALGFIMSIIRWQKSSVSLHRTITRR